MIHYGQWTVKLKSGFELSGSARNTKLLDDLLHHGADRQCRYSYQHPTIRNIAVRYNPMEGYSNSYDFRGLACIVLKLERSTILFLFTFKPALHHTFHASGSFGCPLFHDFGFLFN